MALKAAEIQMKIRENTSELTDFLSDLNRWEDKIKKEDELLKTARRIDEKLPPVRTKKKAKPTTPSDKQDKNNNGNTKQKIKSYDYDAWSKFDVDAACKEVSDDENEASEDEDEVDDEEFEKIQEERRLQQAAMEKEKGNQLFKEGKYEAAINRYTSAITLHPTNPILYANRGMALLKVERYGAAEQDCSVALELDPTYPKAVARRATAREKLKKYAEARQDYESLLKYEPKNKQALMEIEKLDKLLSKTSQLKKDDTAPSSTTTTTTTPTLLEATKVEQKYVKRKRSNKPLRRIYIQEIGGSDDDNDVDKKSIKKNNNKTQSNTPDNKPLANNNRVLHNTTVPMETSEEESKLTVPNTSFIFEMDFKKLESNQERLYMYLKIIPIDQYTKLMHLCIDGLISPFLLVLRNCYLRDKLSIHSELDTLTRVKRFSMAVMFLANKDKEVLQELFRYLLSDDYPGTITEDLVASLRKNYGVKS